ncbi:MAG TPA: 3-oxoacyl-[acyl-carrier-protein] reductase [Anaerolineae bacterium]|nr:3-oxoacyl-[acyl-carrier-protein] reductase [Anaerolineae bacterium]HQH37754.1 3-oxoacyl-[acyl-carrier-protein] reductase [Anaerolineae bacterium]
MLALEGKVALVTGGSRGIGRAIALELACHGADVAVNYVHNATAAQQVVAAITAMGRRAVALPADVGDFDQAAALVTAALDALGRLDILINNAGIVHDALLLRMQETDWDEVLRVNLKGAFNTSKAAVRPMLRQHFGRIINVSSVSGLMGQVGQANYAASKAGLIGLTKSMARELGARNITVNVVAPGFVPTDLNVTLDETWREQLRAWIPLGRFGTADDVAHAVAFLASNEAAYITGAVLPVDGGLSM